MSVTIWHNPRCSKSRQTLALLQEKGIDPEIRKYLENPPDRTELEAVLDKLDLGPRDILRKGEARYKELNLKTEQDRDVLLTALVENPVLIERPIVINGDKAALGRPPEHVLTIL